MKIKFVVEEVISQDFEVEVSSMDNAYDEIRKMYKDGEFILNDPQLTEVSIGIYEENGEIQDFMDLHVN